MNKTVTSLFVGLFSLTLASSPAFAGPKALAPGIYKLDPAHTKVGFEVSHLVISTVEGKFTGFEGQIEAGKKFTDAKIQTTVQTGTVDTGNSDRDKHLRSPDFFDADKFPKMTFVSKKITGTPENFKMMGDLTIKGTTLPVTFSGKYNGTVNDPWGNTKAGFTASTKIKRKDYGLNWTKLIESGPVVGDEVTISLKVEAAMAKEKVAAQE